MLSWVPSSNKNKLLKIVFYDHTSTKTNILFIKTLFDLKLTFFPILREDVLVGPQKCCRPGVVPTEPSAQASEVDAGSPGFTLNHIFHLTSTP